MYWRNYSEQKINVDTNLNKWIYALEKVWLPNWTGLVQGDLGFSSGKTEPEEKASFPAWISEGYRKISKMFFTCFGSAMPSTHAATIIIINNLWLSAEFQLE